MQSVQLAASEIWVTLIFGVIMYLFWDELKRKSVTRILMIVCVLWLLSDAVSWAYDGVPGLWWGTVTRISNYVTFVTNDLVSLVFSVFLWKLVRRDREKPGIVLKAYDWTDFEKEAREAGATAFVAKPIFMSELRSVLTKPIPEEQKPAEAECTHDYSGRRVLLVEDNELNRELATVLLGETGMQIDCAGDGIEAVNIINNAPEDTYDLVLMDIQMPRMDGYTATREIRTLPNNRKANIPIVAMTANAFEEDRRKAFECGMNGHIVKPIDLKSIADVLDHIFM